MNLTPLGGGRSNWVELDPKPATRAPILAPDLGAPNALDKVAAASVIGIFGNEGPLRARGIEDHRNAKAVARAMADPLALPAGSKPFGKTVVFRPALANSPPSPAYVFRMARYTDKLVVAHAYAKPGQDLAPRAVDELYGQKVPPELKGKIFVSGDPANVMVPWPELASLFEKQLEAMDANDVTVVALSAGGVDATETRRRLEAEGKGHVIGKLVNVSSPMRGAPLSEPAFFGTFLAAAKGTGGHVPEATTALSSKEMKRAFTARDERLVDLAVSNSLDPKENRDNSRPIMKLMHKAIELNPLLRTNGKQNDGWIQTESMKFGRDNLHLARAYDHPGMGEDPRIVDEIATRLASTAAASKRPAPGAVDARAELVRGALAVVPPAVREGKSGAKVEEHVGKLADAALRSDLPAVHAAAASVKKIEPKHTLAAAAEALKRRVPDLVLDTVNLFARLGGRALHEGKFDGKTWSSWNRDYQVRPERFLTPKPPAGARSKAETFAPLASAVRDAKNVRVVGGGHAFNESATSKSTMISLDAYDKAGRVPPADVAKTFGVEGERAERFVRVQAGKRLRDLTSELWDQGLAMHVAGSTDAQSLGGLIASDLHGTGRDAAFLSERLREVTLLKADGNLLTFTKREAGWTTDEKPSRRFEHLPVAGALGTLGVVVEAVIETDPAYNLSKDVSYVSREETERNLDAIVAEHDHVSFYYPGGVRDPKTVRMNTWDRTSEKPKWSAPLSRLAHEVSDHAAAAYAPGLLGDVARRDAKTDPLVKALNKEGPEVLPAPTAFARRLFYQHDEIEYAIPRGAHQAALDEVMDMLADEDFRTVVEVRFAPDTTDSILGPGTAGRGQGGSTFIELATPSGPYSEERIAEVHAKFNAILEKHGGRPHLGKKTDMTAADMARIYGDDWTKFQALRKELDPTGRFLPPENEFLNRIFGR